MDALNITLATFLAPLFTIQVSQDLQRRLDRRNE